MSINHTIASIIPIPKKIAHTSFNLYPRKTFISLRIIVNDAQSVVMQHFVSKFIKSFASCIPASRNYHHKVSWIDFFCLCNESIIYWHCANTKTTVTNLVRRISNNHIKLHSFMKNFFYTFVNKWISVGLTSIGTEILAFASTTVFTAILCIP